MNKRNHLTGLLALLVMLGSGLAIAQTGPVTAEKPAASTTSENQFVKAVLKEIQDLETRMVAVAEDFPEDLYNSYRPKGNEDVRTTAEILMHVSEQNMSAASLIRTKQQQEALIASGKRPTAKELLTFVSKKRTAEEVKQSFVAVREAIQNNPDPKHVEFWLYVISHGNWHFGNLVTYYRNNGIVPPSSR